MASVVSRHPSHPPFVPTDHQVEVIDYESVGKQRHLFGPDQSSQTILEVFAVLVRAEHLAPLHPASDHVVERALYIQSPHSRALGIVALEKLRN